MQKIHSYKELIVWQKSIELVVLVYKLTDDFPKSELYTLTPQLRRATVSIPSNIAEGRMRGTRKDFGHFLQMAYASCAEVETQLLIADKLEFSNKDKYATIEVLLGEIIRMLGAMMKKLAS